MGLRGFSYQHFGMRKVSLGEMDATRMDAGVIGVNDESATAWSTLVVQTCLGLGIVWQLKRGSVYIYIYIYSYYH